MFSLCRGTCYSTWPSELGSLHPRPWALLESSLHLTSRKQVLRVANTPRRIGNTWLPSTPSATQGTVPPKDPASFPGTRKRQLICCKTHRALPCPQRPLFLRRIRPVSDLKSPRCESALLGSCQQPTWATLEGQAPVTPALGQGGRLQGRDCRATLLLSFSPSKPGSKITP